MTQGYDSERRILDIQNTLQEVREKVPDILSNEPTEEEAAYPKDFVQFMDQMIHSRKMKRKDVIARSGLGGEYAYKLLNGGKKTRERDYILALCIGARLSVRQTQHALICSGMLPLSESDMRSRVIILGIRNRLDVYKINEHLEDQHLPLIRTASDMPSVKVSDAFYWKSAEDKEDHTDIPDSSDFSNVVPLYNTLDITITFDDMMPADMFSDIYYGHAIVEDAESRKYHLDVQWVIGEGNGDIYARTEEQYQRSRQGEDQKDTVTGASDHDGTDYIEHYDSLLSATKSPFFGNYAQVYEQIEKLLQEHIAHSNDTKYFGQRIDIATLVEQRMIEPFIEYYLAGEQDQCKYFQLVRHLDGSCTFTASTTSLFQKIRWGTYYKSLYKEDITPAYFLKEDAESISKAGVFYYNVFRMLRYHLNMYTLAELHGYGQNPDTLIEEIIEFVDWKRRSDIYNNQNQDAWTDCLEIEQNIEYMQDPVRRMIQSSENHANMILVAVETGNHTEAAKTRKQLFKDKEYVLNHLSDYSAEAQKKIFTPVFRILFRDYVDSVNRGNPDKKMLKEMLDLVENHFAVPDASYSYYRMQVYHDVAFFVLNQDFEAAEAYYLKSISEVLTHHPERDIDYVSSVCALYNNYAALVRDHIGYEEALIYYGRALEVFESGFRNGYSFTSNHEYVFDHIVESMTKLLDQNNRSVEKERLLRKAQAIKALNKPNHQA